MSAAAPADVVVAIPARDEESLVGRCLEQVTDALTHARHDGVIDRSFVVVGAHRCTDLTAEVAERTLARAEVESIVLVDRASATVADVRRTAIAAATPWVVDASRTWVFNTDADSLVPHDWVTGLLAAARHEAAVAVAGLVDVAGWDAPPHAHATYDAIVARRIHGRRHDHAYGANLGVRLDAYREVGGFVTRRHGEERALLRRLRARGHRIATPLAPRVVTSARDDPRSHEGLGALLRRLASGSRDTPGPAREPHQRWSGAD